jgi:hypothetical protein
MLAGGAGEIQKFSNNYLHFKLDQVLFFILKNKTLQVGCCGQTQYAVGESNACQGAGSTAQ